MGKIMIMIEVDAEYEELRKAIAEKKDIGNISFKVPGQIIIPRRYIEDRIANAHKYSFDLIGVRP